MSRYVVQHNYSAYADGERLGPWVKGDEVELDDARAEHVERDSPGVLKPKAARKAKTPSGGAGSGEVPAGAEKEVLAWVGEDAERARLALAAEQTKDSPRKGLTEKLEKLTGGKGDVDGA